MLLVAGGAAAPYVSGYYTKKYYHHALEALSSKSQNYKIEVASYDMGWLHSKASIKLTLPQNMHSRLCPDGKEPLVLKFEETIQHGPVLFGQGDSKMQFAFAKIQGKFAGIDDRIVKSCANLTDFKWPIPPAEMYSSETIVAFNGNLQSKLKGKSFEYKKNNLSLKWHGLNGDMNLDNKMSVLTYKVLFPGLDANEEASSIKVKEMVLNGNHQKLADHDMWLGDFKFNVSSINVQEGQMMIGLNGMTFGHVLRLTNNLLSASANYIVDSVAFDKIKLGPINMMFSFHHLEPDFIDMIKSLDESAHDTPEGYMGALKKYVSKNKEDALTLINKQLKQTPEAKVDQIIIQNQKGQVLINALASMGGPEAKLDKLENYLSIMMMAKASGEFIMDESVFDYMLEEQSLDTANSLPKEFWDQQQTTPEKWVSDNVAKLKDEAIKTGLFVKEGKKMISRFKYENSSFTINGKSITEIMAMHAELNKPKPEPVPAPAVPAPGAPAAAVPAPEGSISAPAAPAAPAVQPQAKPMANNPNDPAKPSEPMPISEVKDMPKVEAPKVEAPKADMPKADMPKVEAPKVEEMPAAPVKQ